MEAWWKVTTQDRLLQSPPSSPSILSFPTNPRLQIKSSVTDIITVEAGPVDHIDPSLVEKGLADFTQKLGSATTELEKAEAQIGVDVHSALNAALAG